MGYSIGVRLWLQLALAMIAVAMAPIAVVSVQALELTGDQAERARKAALEREAIAVADEVGRWVRAEAQAVAGWANLYPNVLEQPRESQRGLLRAVYRAVPGTVTVALLDDDGLVGEIGDELAPVWLAASLPADDPLANRPRGSDARAEDFLSRVPRPNNPGQVLVGLPYLPAGDERTDLEAPWAVPIAARSPFREPVVLALDLTLDEVDEMLALRSVAGRGFGLYTDAGTGVLGHGPTVAGEVLGPLLGQEVATLELPDDGRVGALAAVPGVPWVIVMTEPAAADGAWGALRNRLLVALALALVVAVLAGIIVARSLSRPVAELRTAANRVAEGDLNQRVPADRRDELGELATAFNDMARRLSATLEELEARQAEVEAFNEELQDRVDDRTRDLEAAQRGLVRAGQLAAVAEVGAGLAHELNNPLSSVLGVVQLLKARAASQDERALLAQAETEAWRCREVVDAMLKLAQPGAGDGSTAVVDSGELLAEACGLVEVTLRQRGVSVALERPAPGLEVRLDPVEGGRIITQVLQALGSGLEAGATLGISAAADDTDVVVTLTADRRVASGARRDDYEAAGLSLWVGRKLLDARGGRLEAPPEDDGPWRLVLPGA